MNNPKVLSELVKDVILDLLDQATEDQLIDAYTALKGSRPHDEPAPARVTPVPPAPTSKSGEYPAATTQVTLRAVERLARPAKLGEIAEEVQREQPAITRESVSSAISRLVQGGVLARRGETRASEYYPATRKAFR